MSRDKIIFPKVIKACPPLLGSELHQDGYNKTFVEDVNGVIPCQNDLDCPENEEWFLDNGCGDQEILTVGFCQTFDRLRGKEYKVYFWFVLHH